MVCKHDNGWYPVTIHLLDSLVFEEDYDSEHTILCKCNNIGCSAQRNISFRITDVEVKK
jgi:hypothetical protein